MYYGVLYYVIHPLRHSVMNWEIALNFSKLKPTRRSLVPYTRTKTIFPH